MRSTYNQTQNGTDNQKNFAEYTGAVETFRGTDFTITTETLHLPPSYRILLLPTGLCSFRFGLRGLRHHLGNFLSRLLSNLDIIIYGGPLLLLDHRDAGNFQILLNLRLAFVGCSVNQFVVLT